MHHAEGMTCRQEEKKGCVPQLKRYRGRKNKKKYTKETI